MHDTLSSAASRLGDIDMGSQSKSTTDVLRELLLSISPENGLENKDVRTWLMLSTAHVVLM